jgi:Divalent cation transporter
MDDSDASDAPDEWSNGEVHALSTTSTQIENEDESDDLLPNSHHIIDHDQEEDDNWSRQVETDDLVRVPSSVLEDDLREEAPVPQREEPTLKEKLVERERQRRVETERARLKRHFALRESVTEEEGGDNEAAVDESVAGTVGEGSVVAPVEVLEEGGMTYPMERFLQGQGTNLDEHGATSRDPLRDVQNQGVVMERFLQEPVVVEPATDDERGHPNSTGERNVSFDMDSPGSPPRSPALMNLRTSSMGSAPEEVTATPPRSVNGMDYSVTLSTSIDVNTPGESGTSVGGITFDDDVARIADLVGVDEAPRRHTLDDQSSSLLPLESPTLGDQPRVLGLTQAEIEELAAIEDVSQQNAPPSDRDDLSTSSFVGELVTDFGNGMDHHGGTTYSQGTPTTAMESTSIQSNRASEPTDDQRSMEEQASVDSNLLDDGSAAGGSASVEANPPSELGDTLLSPLPDMRSSIDDLPTDAETMDEQGGLNIWNSQSSNLQLGGSDDLSDLATLNAGVVNRQIRPGRVPARIHYGYDENISSVRRDVSTPAAINMDVDGFDFDKHAPVTPTRAAFAYLSKELGASDMWSPGSHVSVDQSPVRRTATSMAPRPELRSDGDDDRPLQTRVVQESDPLMPSIPSEIITKGSSEATKTKNGAECRNLEKEVPIEYLGRSLFEKVLPSRAIALGATVLLEVPVVVIILGKGDSLFSSLGQSNYHVFMSLLPFCTAVAGSVGLQSNAVMSQRVALGSVSKASYLSWLRQEVSTSAVLGVGMGVLVGLLSFVLSGFNFFFAVAMLLSQSISITAAGLVGCSMPVLLESLMGRQAPKWGELLVAAVQDVLSTSFTIVVTLKMLTLFGPSTLDSTGTCHLATA